MTDYEEFCALMKKWEVSVGRELLFFGPNSLNAIIRDSEGRYVSFLFNEDGSFDRIVI